MVHLPARSLTEDETRRPSWVVGVVFNDLWGVGPDPIANIFNVETATESPIQGMSGHQVRTTLERRDYPVQRLLLPFLTRRQF